MAVDAEYRYVVNMKTFLSLLLVAVVVVGGYVYFVQTAEAPSHEPGEQQQGRIMDIETYIRQNISQLSPEPAVLGGTFYVTSVEASDGHGTVSYEDGHIALTADFVYTVDKYGITISSFAVRE
jgi:hypothetical protein